MLRLWTLSVILLHVSTVTVTDGKSVEVSSYTRVARHGTTPAETADEVGEILPSNTHQADNKPAALHKPAATPEIDNSSRTNSSNGGRKTEILTLGSVGGTGRVPVVLATGAADASVVAASSSEVGTGRAIGGGSAYPFPAFPLVLSPQRAKSISTYAPQQQFFSRAPASSAEYRQQPHIVYPRPSQVASDRFAPGEAYSGTLFKIKQKKLNAAAAATASSSASSSPGSVAAATNINSVSVQNAPASISSYNPAPSGQSPSSTSFNTVRVNPSPVYRPASVPSFITSSYNPQKIVVPASSNIDSSAVPPPLIDSGDAAPPSDNDATDNLPQPPSDNDYPSDNSQYVPPGAGDLFRFPPNNNYDPTKTEARAPPPSASTSYLPPASGDVHSDNYVGPINPDYLPPASKPETQNPVEAVQLAINANSQRPAPPPPRPPPPPPAPYVISAADDRPQSPPPPPPAPAPYLPSDHDHDHSPPPAFNGQYGVDVTPEVVYDYDPHHHSDHHDHDHYPDHFDYHDFLLHHEHHDEPPPPPPPTTVAPEAPPEPRVKTYSYYYLGKKLWYVPLFFTLWFTFYVSALIIKSIARHKVQVPNHWQSRRRRALVEEPHMETMRKVNKLTYFVMNQLTNFEQKYNKED